MPNYTKLADKAAALVASNGRSVTIRKLKSTADDAAKPWRGATDPVTSPADSLSTTAAFVPLSSAGGLGLRALDQGLVKGVEQVLLVAPGSAGTKELEKFHEVVDGTVAWKIAFVERLKPADVTLLFFIGVRR